MRSDQGVKRDAKETLQSSREIDAIDLAAAVRNGIIMLTGFARNELEKYEAERLAHRVAGVLGLANDIEAHPRGSDPRRAPDIADAAAAAIRARLPTCRDRISVVAQLGWITLEGEVEWHYQREAAEGAVRGLKGGRGVDNLIRVRARKAHSEGKRDIEAFRRSATVDVNRIAVETGSGETVLGGTVRPWAEREEAAAVP